MKSLVIKFVLGGAAVALSYIISMVIPWREFGGIFATFPAVYLVSMYLSGYEFGDKVAMHVSRGVVFGMIGVLANILVTWIMLTYTGMWLLSIIVGFIAWFVTAMIVFELVELIAHRRGGAHGRETQRSHG
ncbi:DUF3147 family protein [Staphylococcus pettenkoferi]